MRDRGRFVGYLIGQIVILALPFICFGGIKLFLHAVMPGMHHTQSYDLFLTRNMTPAYPMFWFWAAAVAGISIIVWVIYMFDDGDAFGAALAIVAVGATVMSGMAYHDRWWNNKDYPRFHNQEAKFVVSDISEPPPSLERLLENARPGAPECALTGSHDVPSCILEGQFPPEGWENRSANLAGAVLVMKQASGQSQQVDLLAETAVHIYPPAGQTVTGANELSNGYWSAIRDGSGIRIPTEGVVEWDGRNEPVACTFEGEYELNRSLRGGKKNSLQHYLAYTYPKLRWHLSDAYGYCERPNNETPRPVIVIPVYQDVRFNHRTVESPAGVLLLRGSRDGQPDIDYQRSVEPGKVPGPVYPLSIATTQRSQHTWTAGREYRSRANFGFEPTGAASQSGNATEFLLRSRQDGRTYWVSPLTLRGSDSQLVQSYTIVAADTISKGRLNPLTIYAFNPDDPRVVNIDRVERDVREFVSRQDPGFFNEGTGGQIQEFIPAAGTLWRAFGTINGEPRFVVQINPSGDNVPVIIPLARNFATANDPSPRPGLKSDPSSGPAATQGPCSQPLTQATQDQLLACAQAVLGELGKRNAPAPSSR